MSKDFEPQDELLSASLDGELPAEQQTAVAELLKNDPGAQETLDSYRELSTLLQSVSRPTAPEGLSSQVRRRILETNPTRSTNGARPQTRWAWWSVSLIAAAACVAVMVWPKWQHQQSETSDLLAVNEVATGKVADSIVRLEAEDKEMMEGGEGDFGGGVAPKEAISANVSKLDLRPGESVTAGQILAQVQKYNDRIVVVELTVVGVEETADELMVLLRNTGVKGLSAPTSDDDAPVNLKPSDELMAVYVHADDNRLANVMDQLPGYVSIQEARSTAIPNEPDQFITRRAIDMNAPIVSQETSRAQSAPSTVPGPTTNSQQLPLTTKDAAKSSRKATTPPPADRIAGSTAESPRPEPAMTRDKVEPAVEVPEQQGPQAVRVGIASSELEQLRRHAAQQNSEGDSESGDAADAPGKNAAIRQSSPSNRAQRTGRHVLFVFRKLME